MSREFSSRYPRRDASEEVRLRAALERYKRRVRRSASRLPRLGCLVRGCLRMIALLLVFGLLSVCAVLYLVTLILAR